MGCLYFGNNSVLVLFVKILGRVFLLSKKSRPIDLDFFDLHTF